MALDPEIAKQVDDVKRLLDPTLETPYFEIQDTDYGYRQVKCDHTEHGFTLDVPNRSAICRNCKKAVDNFDALLFYAKAERRLVHARAEIRRNQSNHADKRERDRIRDLSVRKVVSSKPQWKGSGEDLEEDGHLLTLACGHEKKTDRSEPPKEASCPKCHAKIQTDELAKKGKKP